MAWIEARIEFHTQPSPSDSKTKHDHAPGNHTRSTADSSWICKYPDERCKTEPVRYLIGTKNQLYTVIMEEMKDAVRICAACATTWSSNIFIVEISLSVYYCGKHVIRNTPPLKTLLFYTRLDSYVSVGNINKFRVRFLAYSCCPGISGEPGVLYHDVLTS